MNLTCCRCGKEGAEPRQNPVFAGMDTKDLCQECYEACVRDLRTFLARPTHERFSERREGKE